MSYTDLPGAPVAASGRVTQVTAGQGQNEQGQWVRGQNVTFMLASGQTGTVFVPDSMFNPDMVRAAVTAAAANLAAVHNLTF
jgi:hypothetical protein